MAANGPTDTGDVHVLLGCDGADYEGEEFYGMGFGVEGSRRANAIEIVSEK